jgi:hypothetical protein
MTETINSQSHLAEANQLFHEITSDEMELTIGGKTIIPLWSGGPDLQLSSFYDGVNNTNTEYRAPFGLYDNKFFTVDFARTSIYLVV